jgi:hypothetical protein
MHDLTPWRNGNASDSRPEDWGFDSLWGQSVFFFMVSLLAGTSGTVKKKSPRPGIEPGSPA